MRLIGGVAHFIHTEQHATVHRFHTIAHIGKGARHNHRHRVVDVGRLHLVLDIDFKDTVFF